MKRNQEEDYSEDVDGLPIQRCMIPNASVSDIESSEEVLSGLLEEPPNFILYSSRMYPDIKNVSRHIDEAAISNFAEYQT